jgi:hypothetical protein
MNHLDDGAVQAFLDDELPPTARAEAAEHLLGCTKCRAVREELAHASAVFAEAVAVLDVPVPPRTEAGVPTRRARRLGAGSLVKAASLTLLLAAAASAAVPGSPVRAGWEWIARTVDPAPEPAAPSTEETSLTPVVEAPPVGVSLVPAGRVDVVVTALEGTTLRLVETDDSSVGVTARGAATDPRFRTAPGRIEVRGAVGGEVTIELPRSLAEARVVVDGEVYAEKEAGELRVRVAATSEDGARIWR